MSPNAALIDRRRAVVPRGVGQFTGDAAVHSGEGARLQDLEGRTLLDFAGGIGVMNVGHCNPAVVRAVQEQAQRLLHTCIHVGTYEPYVALCEALVQRFPHGASTQALLLNSGAEAVENAIKIARLATRRPAILTYSEAFHGRTLLALTLTSKTGYKAGCGPFAPEVYRLPFPNHFRYGEGLSEKAFVSRELQRLHDAFHTLVPAEQVAAVIIEPVQGEGGFVPVPRGYLERLRQVCDHHGILLICDEVQSGFCRTGRWAAYEHYGIVPDLSTWAKSMGGGLPISAVIGRAEVMSAPKPGTLGGTYGGNPVACAAALATLSELERLDANTRALHIGQRCLEHFGALQQRCDLVADVRGLGAMVAVELCQDRDPHQPAGAAATQVLERCLARGVLVLNASPYGNVLRILSPLVIDDQDLERGLEVICSAVLEVAGELRAS